MADLIKRQLLYCHSVVLFDPLPYIADFLPVSDSRIQLENYLSWLFELSPLVKSGALCFISELGYKENPGILMNNLFRMFEGLQEDEVLQRIEESLSSEMKPLASWCLNNAKEHLFEMQQAISTQPNLLDFYFAAPYFRSIFKAQFPDTIGGVSSYLALPNLLSIEIPNLDEISVADMVNIRTNDETFETWRKDIRDSLLYVDKNRDRILDENGSLEQSLSNELKERARAIQDALSKNSWFGRAKRGVGGFAIGGVGTVSQSVVTDESQLAASLVAPLVSGLAASIFPLGGGNGSASSAFQHYVMFNKK